MERKKLKNKIIKILEHNEHSLDITIRGRTISPCARCTGMYLGLLTIMITSFLYWLGILHFPLQLITTFILSWFFVTPAVIDWVSTKTGIRKGNNRIRVVTGFFLGIGIGTYFFLMPAGILFKVLTFITYQLMIGMPTYAIYNKKAGLPIKKQVFLFKQPLKHFFQPQERRLPLADNTMGQEGIGCPCFCPLLCCCMSQSLRRGRRGGRGGQLGC